MKKKSSLSASSKSISSHLETLFASSAGPVEPIPLSQVRSLQSREEATKTKSASEDGESGDDEVLSEASQELEYDDDDDDENYDGKPSSEEEGAEERSSVEKDDAEEEEAKPRKKVRKRKREDDNEQLEEKYLAALARKDREEEPTGKRVKADEPSKNSEPDNDGDGDDQETVPTHESLSKESEAAEAAKAARTVFVSNVAIEAVSSKAAKKTLLAHLASVLDRDGSDDGDDKPAQKIESIRFRSVAFSTGSMPKRAAYITKSVMAATTRSTNAYVVFSTAAAARRVCQRLNGTEVLDRHIRVDSVAHPSPTDHRRCVFVGNLGFVDDEKVLAAGPDGAQEAKKRSKVPADVEEGLWRTFSAHGKVENVRVVRDPKTRVGKGFAYVQFYDANAVEEALLLDGKSFPPMLPRRLRVTRAKDPRKTAQAVERARAKLDRRGGGGASFKNGRDGGAVATSTYVPKMTPDQQTAAGRAGKLFGRARGSKGSAGARLPAGVKDPQRIVFEGRRASARDSLPKDLKPKNRTKGAKRKRPVMASTRGGGGDGDWKKMKKSDE